VYELKFKLPNFSFLKKREPSETDIDPQVSKKMRRAKRGLWMRIPMPIRKGLISVVVVFGLVGVFSMAAFAWYAFEYLDPTMDLGNIDSSLDYTTVVYAKDSSGTYKEIEHLYKDENRIWVDLKDIPENLQWAFIAIEDERFYSHNGVDWIRTGGAVLSMATGGKTYGGSTITQQLIKNLTGDDDVKISRKIS
jgi:penicillin-binding protein 1A